MVQNDKNIINLLKKFPDQNPNPVLRFSIEGILEYYNSPAKRIIQFFDLEMSEKVIKIFKAQYEILRTIKACMRIYR